LTPLILLDELCKELTGIVQNFRLQTTKKTTIPPRVWPGYLPTNDNNENEDEEVTFPYVIARIIDVEDKEKESIAKIVILIGTYSEDDDFWRDCINVGERIRQGLLIKRQLGNQFRMKLPLKLECPDGTQQPYPEAIAWLTTLWHISQPQQRLEEGIYGENIPGRN